MTTPQLRVIPSEGPRTWTDPELGSGEYSTPCPACDEHIRRGQFITHTGRQWAHAQCVTDWLVKEKADAAWLVLASQLARRPRSFSAAETTTVVAQLLRLAGGMPPAPWEPEHRDYVEPGDDQEDIF
jgi:hypothetical protein